MGRWKERKSKILEEKRKKEEQERRRKILEERRRKEEIERKKREEEERRRRILEERRKKEEEERKRKIYEERRRRILQERRRKEEEEERRRKEEEDRRRRRNINDEFENDYYSSEDNDESDENINDIINKLPVRQLKSEDVNKLNEENKRCIICFDDFKDNDNLIYLPCFHFYHKKCIINWIQTMPSCPFCKIKINQSNLNKIWMIYL